MSSANRGASRPPAPAQIIGSIRRQDSSRMMLSAAASTIGQVDLANNTYVSASPWVGASFVVVIQAYVN
ncbi:MAG: hypothetical protein GY859_03580 [Desulfobacterales bacterium]|nr:hypothetical protein [Desulfobacterales bacterium]